MNGPSRFLGFLGNDELTEASLTDWGGYRTGDLGALDADGHLLFIGRSKDIIRRGGVTIVPAEVEPVIMRHPDVHEVAIVPLPDERMGERACAAIIPVAGHEVPTLEELQEFLAAEGVAKYTWPERVEAVRGLPADAVAEGDQARHRHRDRRARAGDGLSINRSARASCRWCHRRA